MKQRSASEQPICYLVETADGHGGELKYLSATKPRDEWATIKPLYTIEGIRATEYELQSKKWRDLKHKVVKWWWMLWTGDPSLEGVRRRIENDARRFNGRVTWDD